MSINQEDSNQSSWVLIAVILVIVIGIFIFWKFGLSNDSPIEDDANKTPVATLPIEDVIAPIQEEVLTEQPMVETVLEPDDSNIEIDPDIIEEVVQIEPTLDKTLTLNESDSWVKETLTSIIWRKELLDLVVNDDVIRRFVVFVDNFAQGNISYNNSPLVKPLSSFSVVEEPNNNGHTFINESSFERFSRYVELLRAVDTDILVAKYLESEPLIAKAYSELGYSENDFTIKLEKAITKILDVEYPKEKLEITRPSVMYKYKDQSIESLDNAEKLMIRLGKENLLVIKSVLLEINEKLQK